MLGKRSRLFTLLALSSLCAACGYHWTPESPLTTLSIPFIKGDDDGTLTEALCYAFSRSGFVHVVSRQGEYQLQTAILNAANEKIGFRQDPQKVDGEVRNNLLAIEGRQTVSLEITLLRNAEVVYGPYIITADADYDYVDGDSVQDLTFTAPNGSLVTVLPFSLGQLEPIEAAQEGARTPLYRKLAQKTVDAIRSAW